MVEPKNLNEFFQKTFADLVDVEKIDYHLILVAIFYPECAQHGNKQFR